MTMNGVISTLVQRARDSGRCPPSLLSGEHVVDADGFAAGLEPLLDSADFFLAPEAEIGDRFMEQVKKAESTDKMSADREDVKKATLVQRRALLLAVAAGTPQESPSMTQLLSEGYVHEVKVWLDDILSESVGGVDLLLHLLSSIVHLPVTKSIVKDSGMGKAIGKSIDKHRLCAGTPNEAAIKERVQQIKDAWSASVKVHKSKTSTSEPKAGMKRTADTISPSSAKRIKIPDESSKKASSFSSLLAKVSKADDSATKVKSSAKPGEAPAKETSPPQSAKSKKKKTSKRVKWADHFGSMLSKSKEIESEEVAVDTPAVTEGQVSWSDRKKRDRMREKELLAKARKSKLLDDDDDSDLALQPAMRPTMEWHVPTLLPERTDVTLAQLSSAEVTLMNDRMQTVPRAFYAAELDVPYSPIPLSDVEQALDMTSQASALVESIPFFVPEAAAPLTEPAPAPLTESSIYSSVDSTSLGALSFPLSGGSSAATPEFVQALGLPMFLVGQDTQALQTLANSPSLLSTLVDANGMYDQPRLMSLVQTLSATSGPMHGMSQPPTPAYQPPSHGIYGPASTSTSQYGQPPPIPSAPPPRRNGLPSANPEGNLHVSGFGPSTTENDLIALFAPFVIPSEIVMKGSFAFVNTSDPHNARRAREALDGTIVGGMPIRINPAQRKGRTGSSGDSSFGGSSGAASAPFGGPSGGLMGTSGPPFSATTGQTGPPFAGVQGGPPPFAAPSGAGFGGGNGNAGVMNVDAVRDDRGNPATKNLFVAGYGPGTTEQQLRDVFGQHVEVIGVVLKGTFTFVNTSDRESAVRARNALSGQVVNGGALRINFAKETGRLGTSFDLTYGRNTGPNSRRPSGPPSYYGR